MKVTRTNGANNKILEVSFKNKRTNKTNFLNKFPEGATLEWVLRNLSANLSNFSNKALQEEAREIIKEANKRSLYIDTDNLPISMCESLAERAKLMENGNLMVTIIW